MEKYIISGGRKLYGKVEIQSAKNSVLPLIAASVLRKGKTVIEKCSKLKDVIVMCEILRQIGGKYEFVEDNLIIDTTELNTWELPSMLTGEIRASLFMVGALLSRFGYAIMRKPGGCKIGERALDIHIDGLRTMGVVVDEGEELVFKGRKITSAKVKLRFPSVGATENLMMVAVRCKGTTIIENCAKEPEIVDLQKYLNLIGARVSGAGTDVIEIDGVDNLFNGEVNILPIADRIEIGTFLFAGFATGGELEFDCPMLKNSKILHRFFKNNACKIYANNGKIYNIEFNHKLRGFGKVVTGPYPEFPTDLQPQLVACASVHNGLTAVEERVFPDRFGYTVELAKLGAKVEVFKNLCLIQGGRLNAQSVTAGDLRGGAALVIGGLVADGDTEIKDVRHIERGYYKLEEKLSLLGAKIQRVIY